MPTKFTKSSSKRIKNSFEIINTAGVHTRPAAAFVKIASRFPAQISVCKKNMCVDGKSILGLLELGAKKGETLRIEAEGAAAEEALRKLGALIKAGFHE